MVTNVFTIDGPLPRSTLLLEASAGTGKTFTIAGLAVRYIAEAGMSINQILMITFSNNAATELRTRVFEAIDSCAESLRQHLAGEQITDDADYALVARHLARLGDVEERIARLESALDNFDQAAVFTIHKFCQRALQEMGILGDADHAEELSAAEQLMEECGADCFLAKYHDVEQPPFAPDRALRLAKEACKTSIELAPADAEETIFGNEVRAMFTERKQALGILTFDDLVARLRAVLRHGANGPAAIRWLQHAYRAVLVDEFQDTDPDQWEVIQAAFVDDDRPTILIGDPKQSIYGFRKADLRTYLRTAEIAERQTLGTNFRSDEGIVDGVVHLMQGLDLGHGAVRVQDVKASHPNRLDLKVSERIWIRQARGERVQERVLDDLVAQVDALLGLRVDDRLIELSDIAVLVRARSVASQVTQRFNELGYPAVLYGASNVWEQPAADDWKRLLRGLEPDGGSAERVVALTDLVGMRVDELASSAGTTQLADMMRSARQALVDDGPSAALDVIRERTALEARLVGQPGGERYLTDLLHIGELLDESGHRSTVALLRTIDEQSKLDGQAELRVTTDASSIRVMTLHSAKGLEFPIVLLPDMSPLRHYPKRPFHVELDEASVLWMRQEPQGTHISDLAARQARQEELRLLYVGLTRAKHLAIAWHTDERNSSRGPLSAVMFHDRSQPQLADAYPWSTPSPIPLVRVDAVPEAPVAPRNLRKRTTPTLHLATAHRSIDQQWRRTSYTGLTQGTHDAPSGADEPDTGDELVADPALSTPAPMGTLPAGAEFGTLVHEALEVLDWSGDGRRSHIAEVVRTHAIAFAESERAILADGLEAVVTTPLLPLTPQSLSDIPTQLRLAELDFDLPMGGDTAATVGELAQLMQAHIPANDPLVEYPNLLAASEASHKVLSGMLTGSIDAVLRTEAGKFLVVDYKTNRLAPSPDGVLTLGHYTQAAMAHAMMAAHYPLQAICYSAALHRYLAVRLPGYVPERHLGGVGYLFIRGMAGPTTPLIDGHTCGVFSWYPSPDLVVSVSDLLGGHHA